MAGQRLTLFTGATGNGATASVRSKMTQDELDFVVYGVFDGATVALQTLAPDGTTWIPQRDVVQTVISATASGTSPTAVRYSVSLPYGVFVRGFLASVTGNTSLSACLQRRGRDKK